jgi:MFS family permease
MLRRPGAILALLTTLNLLNYLDRYILSAVLPLIQDELHISGFIAGTLATVFLVGYFATSPLFGQLADREGVRGGRKGLMAAGVALWSAATAATGFAGGTTGLLATRAFVGVGEASYATIAPTIIDDLAPPERKGRWLSIFYVAIPVGSALGFVVGGILGKHFGWRAAFFAVGGPGVLAALACLLIAEPARRSALKHVAIVKTARALIAIRLYRRAILGYAAQTFAIGGFGYWAPTYIYRHYGVPLDKASGTFGVILVLAGGAGTAFGGWWSDRWIARAGAAGDDASMARIALRVCSIPSFLAAPLAAAAVLAPTAQGAGPVRVHLARQRGHPSRGAGRDARERDGAVDLRDPRAGRSLVTTADRVAAGRAAGHGGDDGRAGGIGSERGCLVGARDERTIGARRRSGSAVQERRR